MQKNKNITEIIKSIISDIGMIDDDFDSNSHIKNDLGLDSMSIIMIILELNKEFNIEIKSTDVKEENFSNLNKIDIFIRSLIK